MRNCQDCVRYKCHPNVALEICLGAWADGVCVKPCEKLDNLSKAVTCEFYDDDSWVK